MSESRMLRRNELIEGWRNMHDEQLHNLYTSPNDGVKEGEIGRACSTEGGEEEFDQENLEVG
jgi:hypothetical protein